MPTRIYGISHVSSHVVGDTISQHSNPCHLLPTGCVDEFQQYQDGQTWLRQDDCTYRYRCVTGQVTKAELECQPPPSPDCLTVPIPGLCCPLYDCSGVTAPTSTPSTTPTTTTAVTSTSTTSAPTTQTTVSTTETAGAGQLEKISRSPILRKSKSSRPRDLMHRKSAGTVRRFTKKWTILSS